MEAPVPDCVRWTCRDVGGWLRRQGFPQYEACFTDNAISGRKLIHVTCATLPQIGVTDFQDMKAIARLVRDLLGVTDPPWSRSIALPPRDNLGLFLEQKSQSGANSDMLTYHQFLQEQGL
ncbi:sterile alpha motif domain-containing protein 15 [Gastrophryne carolinensis]